MRRAAKRDANEDALTAIARRLGVYLVQEGPLDWWAWWRGAWYVVEIKNPGGRNRYTEIQERFIAQARERGFTVWTWRDESDVLASLDARRAA